MVNVVNKYKFSGKAEYIGRGSVLGNPFVIGKHGNRDAVCDKYQEYLDAKIKAKDPVFMQELRRLYVIAKAGDLNLKCYCSPSRCHGDSIKEFLEQYL